MLACMCLMPLCQARELELLRELPLDPIKKLEFLRGLPIDPAKKIQMINELGLPLEPSPDMQAAPCGHPSVAAPVWPPLVAPRCGHARLPHTALW